jgi:hypothetical protein
VGGEIVFFLDPSSTPQLTTLPRSVASLELYEMSTAIEERAPELRRTHASEDDSIEEKGEKAARPTLVGGQEKVGEDVVEAMDQ